MPERFTVSRCTRDHVFHADIPTHIIIRQGRYPVLDGNGAPMYFTNHQAAWDWLNTRKN